MLKNIAYTYKRKHKCLASFMIFGVFQLKDILAMLFLLTAYILLS